MQNYIKANISTLIYIAHVPKYCFGALYGQHVRYNAGAMWRLTIRKRLSEFVASRYYCTSASQMPKNNKKKRLNGYATLMLV